MKLTAPAMLALALVPGAVLAQDEDPAALVARGEYIVTTTGRGDCPTPMTVGSNGPEPDLSGLLSGHPQEIAIEAPAQPSDPWVAASNGTNTAWSGPWAVSFSANLTPDPETGVLRDVSEEQFIETMRTGRHKGQGRPFLPPMSWPAVGQMTDEDLRAIYAHLHQIPPIPNQVPEPMLPGQ